MNQKLRRIGYGFLCALPFLGIALVSARPLRTAGMFPVVGVVVFMAVVIAAWVVMDVRAVIGRGDGSRKLALAGFLLIMPWAVISLLWVGMGAPFQATLSENYLRYLVLVWNSILVTVGFIVLKDALSEASERFYSAIGFAAALLAGMAYLVSLNIDLGQTAMFLHGDKTPPPLILVAYFYSGLEFIACIMTYVATAAFAMALWRARFLGRGAAYAYVTASAVLMLLIVVRGLDYPEISGSTAPWYTRPGVIAGIPAVPWVMACLLGAVLLRQVGAQS